MKGNAYKPDRGTLTFSVLFFSIAAHAFVYQDIGRRQYGEIVTGGAAMAVGVIMCSLATWATALYFRRARQSGLFSWFSFTSFATLVAICMGIQLLMRHLGASCGLARISTLAVTALAWPLVFGIHWFPEEIRKQKQENLKGQVPEDTGRKLPDPQH